MSKGSKPRVRNHFEFLLTDIVIAYWDGIRVGVGPVYRAAGGSKMLEVIGLRMPKGLKVATWASEVGQCRRIIPR